MFVRRLAIGLSLASPLLVAGCGSTALPGSAPGVSAARASIGTARVASAQPADIRNVILVVQEDRSFDNLFSGYPGADAPTSGYTNTGQQVPLKQITFKDDALCVRISEQVAFNIAYAKGKMDGWNLLNAKNPLCPYTHVARSETKPYWDLAKQYAIADHFFASTHFGSFPNQLYLIAGTTLIAPNTYDIGLPTQEPGNCDSPPGTVTSILRNGKIEYDKGPYPCFTQFPTMANLLDRHRVTWRYYSDLHAPYNAYAQIEHVFEGPDWKRNISSPSSNVLSDIANGNLTSVSWVISPPADSDFPGTTGGPAWVKAIAQALQKSAYWPHSALIVVWSSPSSEYYDDLAPPQLDPMGLGFRVPMFVVSPYAKRGYVSHVEYEFGSILRFIEDNWKLGSLGATDRRATSIGTDIFTF